MKAHTKEEKEKIMFRFAVCIYKAMQDIGINQSQLAVDIDMEKSHLQLLANGKKNPTLSTQIAIANGLKISYSRLAAYYDSVSKSDEKKFAEYQKKQQELKAHNKKAK